MSREETVGAVCDRRERVVKVDWTLEDFFSLPEKVDDSYFSPVFDISGRPFRLQLYPNGQSHRKSEGWVALFLIMGKSRRPPIEVTYTLGIKTAKGEIEEWTNYTYTFEKTKNNFGLPRAIERSALSQRREELAPSGAVTIYVALKTDVPFPVRGTAEFASQTNWEDDVREEGESDGSQPEKRGGEKVLEDIGKLWISGDHSDVVVKIGNVEFEAHRSILAARTPVLGAMFRHDTAEKASGVVTIDDCDPEVLKEFLHYIYTGSPQQITAKNASALYEVAEKYLATDLKSECSRCLRDTLSLDTFCSTAALSLRHGETELLELCVDFFSRNTVEVMKTVEWQKFLDEHSTWANEMTINAVELLKSRR